MNALFDAIFNGLILSIFLAALVWLILRLTPRRALNAATRHAVWWTAAAVILSLPVLFAPLPRWTTKALPAGVTSVNIPPVQVIAPAPALPPAAAREPAPPARFPVRVTTGPWTFWLAGAWAAVSVLLLLRLLLSYLTLDRYKARATRLGAIWVSSDVATPLAAGPFRPRILIPAALLDCLSAAEIDQIVRHEAAHLARRDDLTLLVQRLLEALFPWHPALRFAMRQMAFEREVACDDFVLCAAGIRPYAACLTRLAELANPARSLAAHAAAQSRSHLIRRVDLLFDKSRHTGTHLLRAPFAAAAALLAAACWIAAQSPVWVAFAAPPPPERPRLLTPLPPPLPAPELLAQATPTPPKPAVLPPPATPQPFTVVVPVTVTEPRGRFVTGLNKENFEIYDDNIKQEITGFSSRTEPASIAIVLDPHNGSGLARDVNTILSRFPGGGNEFFYVSVHGPLQLTLPPDVEAIPGNPIGLLDAIALAAQRLSTARNRSRSIWVLTEGGEVSFGVTEERLVSLAQAAGAQVHVFRPGAEISGEISALLDNLSEQTGGTTTTFEDLLFIPGAVARVTLSTLNLYLLEFIPQGQPHEGYHALAVRVNWPNLIVRARAGYYVP